MASNRIGRINEEIQRELSSLIRTLKDPRVQSGMGAIFLHSSHLAKPFRRLMGTGCTLKWREINERDYQDMHRDIAPLREAEDAVRLDTSKLNFEESERALLNLIQEKLK